MNTMLIFYGFMVYAVFKVIRGFYTVKPDERAVITSFGKAQRLPGASRNSSGAELSTDEKGRYDYPVIAVRGPGGPYLKWPWQRLHKVSVATQSVDLCWDPT